MFDNESRQIGSLEKQGNRSVEVGMAHHVGCMNHYAGENDANACWILKQAKQGAGFNFELPYGEIKPRLAFTSGSQGYLFHATMDKKDGYTSDD